MHVETGWHLRSGAALGAAAIVAAAILGHSAAPPSVVVPAVAVPFDSNGLDDSFTVAMSREQGPLIDGSTSDRSVGAAAVPTRGDPVAGTFGPMVGWPIMPIHAVLLPDGRVLSYGTDRNGASTAYYEYDLWEPRAGTGTSAHVVRPNGTQTDIFCSSQILLLNGDVELYGGDELPASTKSYNSDVNQFRPADDTLVRTGSMNRLRWYASATVLPNAEIYIQGGSGGEDLPELRTSAGTFRLLTGASTSGLSSGYPKNFLGPDGLIFGLANKAMYRVNPAGNGSIMSLGTFPTDNAGATATSVMFAPGRIVQVGGGNLTGTASRNASIIDINGASPQITAIPQLQYGRHWANATVLADGRVLVSGGSAVNNTATGVAYTTEIFDPATNTWSVGATATRMRLYHSTSLLLPDASVITMGGGAPGPETNLNAEIYYPPYLFAGDGNPAVRPTITSATPVVDPGTTLHIETPNAAAVARVSLVKFGSVTHSVDMDQRFLELAFSTSTGNLQAALPVNANLTPPGYYMLFIIDAAGVPSEAEFVKINVAGTSPPPQPTPTTSPPPPPSDVDGPPPLTQAATVTSTAERGGQQFQLTEPPATPASPRQPLASSTAGFETRSGSPTGRRRR